MKKIAEKIILCFFAGLMIFCFAACGNDENTVAISPETAESLMVDYLENKGFSEGDFLSECTVMNVNGVQVYAFSWRVKAGENADKLFGMYAVSFDGKSFYEYQSARDEWIKDMNIE